MSRSTLRHALRAGALCLTATTTAAVLPAAADAKVGVSAKRLNVQVGSRVIVKGHAPVGREVRLQIVRRGRWVTVRRDRANKAGHYALLKRVNAPLSTRARLRTNLGATKALGRVNVYRHALASWYGPGLYGNPLGCGGRLYAGSLGVANKTLPCGTKVTIRHRGNVVRVPVIDRGPYVGAREYDLTAATARRLGFSGAGTIQVTR